MRLICSSSVITASDDPIEFMAPPNALSVKSNSGSWSTFSIVHSDTSPIESHRNIDLGHFEVVGVIFLMAPSFAGLTIMSSLVSMSKRRMSPSFVPAMTCSDIPFKNATEVRSTSSPRMVRRGRNRLYTKCLSARRVPADQPALFDHSRRNSRVVKFRGASSTCRGFGH